MNKAQMKKELAKLIPEMQQVRGFDSDYLSVWVGSSMSLDPCGKFHCAFIPNSPTKKCERYWDQLNKAAEELGGWIESGVGDPTDVFFCMPLQVEFNIYLHDLKKGVQKKLLQAFHTLAEEENWDTLPITTIIREVKGQ